VFLPYTREVFNATWEWLGARNLFAEPAKSTISYDEAVLL
jgi:hypothetical protein